MNESTPEPGIENMPSPLVQLERQVERGSFFTHTALGRQAFRVNEIESFTYGLIDALLAKGLISTEEINASVETVREEMMTTGEVPDTGVALRTDSEASAERPPTKVDCEARWPVCHGICCKLDFALTQEEVEGGKIKWDLGRPYFIRHEADGLCTHSERGSGKCGVYNDRPAICRNYSCEHDKRIWKDFEKMELNTEWLTEHFYESRPRALTVLMSTNGMPSCRTKPANEPASNNA